MYEKVVALFVCVCVHARLTWPFPDMRWTCARVHQSNEAAHDLRRGRHRALQGGAASAESRVAARLRRRAARLLVDDSGLALAVGTREVRALFCEPLV